MGKKQIIGLAIFIFLAMGILGYLYSYYKAQPKIELTPGH